MGTWSVGPFNNDDAVDFLADVVDDGIDAIQNAFERVLAVGSGYLEAPDAQQAIAAAEIVARMSGGDGVEGQPELEKWMKTQRDRLTPETVQLARLVASRILKEPSELLELWSEAEEFEAWQESVQGLIERLP